MRSKEIFLFLKAYFSILTQRPKLQSRHYPLFLLVYIQTPFLNSQVILGWILRISIRFIPITLRLHLLIVILIFEVLIFQKGNALYRSRKCTQVMAQEIALLARIEGRRERSASRLLRPSNNMKICGSGGPEAGNSSATFWMRTEKKAGRADKP